MKKTSLNERSSPLNILTEIVKTVAIKGPILPKTKLKIEIMKILKL